ncbi:integrin beta-1-like [Brienomyrus brachyistius]|uniref:integrin beta-1-like n=1 Tax=Brienomyrus brachyistius TaxID=42636 RepID=UPI0020B34EDC|nr:integrin beta-1-like [Brienomyrus brachyistius]
MIQQTMAVGLFLCFWPWVPEADGGRGEPFCHATGVTSCQECLASGPQCAWCKAEGFVRLGQHTWERCGTVQALLARGCPTAALEDPRGSNVLLQNRPVASRHRDPGHRPHDVTQLQPQKVLLKLRPGEPQTFEVKFRRVEGYPVDMYYLMDLSFSMENDLLNVKKLGTDLMEEMRNITEDFRIGFGAFVDKTVMPYISTSEQMLKNPCKRVEPKPCAPAFGFRHVLSLTNDGNLFSQMVGEQHISGNLDLPEGGLDALMQAAVCEEQIGWRNVTRLLVFSTDAGFHFAGDGKLGGIILPSDGKCHLKDNVYTMSTRQDYPSLAHLAEKLREKNIQTIFAVTEDVVPLYEKLKQIFPTCTVGTLSNDSHNILQLIVEAYNALTSEVIMDNSELPPGFQIEYSSTCKGHVTQTGEAGRRCSGVSIGDEVTFQVSVTAPPCTAETAESQLLIKAQGFSEEVEVLLRPLCRCQCAKDSEPHSSVCSGGRGTLECGACRCDAGHVGTFCECEAAIATMGDLCRRDNASEVCGGRGDCVCGQCVCHMLRRSSGHAYYGQYCQCDDLHCDQHQGVPCGGRGRCECGVCRCSPGFSSSACECPTSTVSCLGPNGLLCSGRGHCVCGTCVCGDARFQGPSCELCPSCPDVCVMHRECVLCQVPAPGLVDGRCSTECSSLNLTLVPGPQLLPQERREVGLRRCRERDADGCWVQFSHQAEWGNTSAHLTVALHKECPPGPNVVLITAVVSGSVVLLGLALLLLWKLLTTIHDRREFARFQNEVERARWDTGDNPIYKSAVTTIKNPKYKAH